MLVPELPAKGECEAFGHTGEASADIEVGSALQEIEAAVVEPRLQGLFADRKGPVESFVPPVVEIVVADIVAKIPFPVLAQRSAETDGRGAVGDIDILLRVIVNVVGADGAVARVQDAHDAGNEDQVTAAIGGKFGRLAPAGDVPTAGPGIDVGMLPVETTKTIEGRLAAEGEFQVVHDAAGSNGAVAKGAAPDVDGQGVGIGVEIGVGDGAEGLTLGEEIGGDVQKATVVTQADAIVAAGIKGIAIDMTARVILAGVDIFQGIVFMIVVATPARV